MIKKITIAGLLLLGVSTVKAQHVIQTVRGIHIKADTDAKGGNEGISLFAANKELAYFTPANNVHLVRTFFKKETIFQDLTRFYGVAHFHRDANVYGNFSVSGNSTFSKIGIGITPQEGIHLSGRNIRVDGGEFQSHGPIVLHPDVDKNGDDKISFRNSQNGEMAWLQDGVFNTSRGVFNTNITTDNAQIQQGTFGSVSYTKSTGRLNLGHGKNDKISFINGDNNEMASLQNGIMTLDKVVLNIGSFPDYVFSEDYDLMPLKDVATYIKENKHLPNMPSEKEVVSKGMDVKQINTILVEKVEELTLHTIAQEEKINILLRELQAIKRELKLNQK